MVATLEQGVNIVVLAGRDELRSGKERKRHCGYLGLNDNQNIMLNQSFCFFPWLPTSNQSKQCSARNSTWPPVRPQLSRATMCLCWREDERTLLHYLTGKLTEESRCGFFGGHFFFFCSMCTFWINFIKKKDVLSFWPQDTELKKGEIKR